jgi:predicted nucleic acid-binding protein
MISVFIDTSYLLALELANDQNHPAAVRHWRQTVAALPRLVTTS